MQKLWTIVVVLLSALAWASDKQESIESLKARADLAQPKDQVELFTRIAERQLDSLDRAYNGGTVREAQAALADVVNYGVKAAKISSETGKRMKQTEIAMRKIAGRLEAIRKTLEVDERPPLADAVQRLETARSELLNRMFRK
jgi:response regulator RpfG family c-di-GMP phosphodiesterase